MDNDKNYVDLIKFIINKDARNSQNQSELLTHFYNNATPSEQKVIDTIIVCICGYSLDTIINHPENIK